MQHDIEGYLQELISAIQKNDGKEYICLHIHAYCFNILLLITLYTTIFFILDNKIIRPFIYNTVCMKNKVLFNNAGERLDSEN